LLVQAKFVSDVLNAAEELGNTCVQSTFNLISAFSHRRLFGGALRRTLMSETFVRLLFVVGLSAPRHTAPKYTALVVNKKLSYTA